MLVGFKDTEETGLITVLAKQEQLLHLGGQVAYEDIDVEVLIMVLNYTNLADIQYTVLNHLNYAGTKDMESNNTQPASIALMEY